MRMLYIVLALIVVLTAAICYCEHAITKAAEGKTYTSVQQVPHHKVGLLLGTGPVSVFGGVNPYFTSRIDATVQLVKAGKIDCVLISGDNKGPEYNEPQIMRDSLIAHGVPDSIITKDDFGHNTHASIVNARYSFHIPDVLIISQQFHNERALYMAQNNDLKADAFSAGQNYYGGIRKARMWARERLSRLKAVAEHLIKD